MPHWLTILLGAVTTLATAYGLIAGGRKALADARATKTSPPPSWPEVWARMDRQQEEIDELRADVQGLRQTEGRLVGWVGRLHAGITDGTIPPLPPIPDWLDHLLHKTKE